jgi:endonuclease/exonuclease/phosphatase family metal-dependent hydrolase
MWLLLLACVRLPPADTDEDPGVSPPPPDTDTGWSDAPVFADDPTRIQFVTYNAEWLADHYEGDNDFVPRNETDYERIRQLLEDSGFDLMVLQETEGRDAIDLLGLDGRYAWKSGESGWSQHISFVWRTDRMRVDGIREIRLPSTEYPQRSPLVGEVTTHTGLRFTVVGIHNKPYSDDVSAEYRATQVRELHAWLRDELPLEVDADLATHVILAGDFNDTFAGIGAVPSLAELERDPDLTFASRFASDVTYPSYNSLIDHIVLTAPMAARWTELGVAGGAHVIAHDTIEPWCCYTGGFGDRQNISDHRPMWVDLTIE